MKNENKTNQVDTELLPCPFCGGEAGITKHFREEMYRLLHRCSVMGSMAIDWMTKKETLIERWNTRF